MPQPPTNRRIVLATRPKGAPTPDDFRLEEGAAPVPGDGQALLRTLYLSLDPYMRGRMSDAPSYAAPTPVGDVMPGGTVSRVEASRHADYGVGDLVVAYSGWQEYALSNGQDLVKLDPTMPRPSYALGVLGMPGLTAYGGLLDIGAPQTGETLVVGAATGAVGSVVGQIARIKGCRVIGVAGGETKCRYAVEELGFDACVDHRQPDLPRRLAEACPDGVDIYWENVGGAVLDAALPILNAKARIPVCGLIAHYNDQELPPGPDRVPLLMSLILRKRLRVQGFIVLSEYGGCYPEFIREMSAWLEAGKVCYREDVVAGLENAPTAFIGLLQGRNFGKLVVQVSE
ncbi:MAG: NADP-dependent oxidoreductase [Actinomycetota bacterium]